MNKETEKAVQEAMKARDALIAKGRKAADDILAATGKAAKTHRGMLLVVAQMDTREEQEAFHSGYKARAEELEKADKASGATVLKVASTITKVIRAIHGQMNKKGDKVLVKAIGQDECIHRLNAAGTIHEVLASLPSGPSGKPKKTDSDTETVSVDEGIVPEVIKQVGDNMLPDITAAYFARLSQSSDPFWQTFGRDAKALYDKALSADGLKVAA